MRRLIARYGTSTETRGGVLTDTQCMLFYCRHPSDRRLFVKSVTQKVMGGFLRKLGNR